MTTLDHGTHDTLRFAPRQAIATRLVATVANAWRAWKNRHAFYALGEMSDVELADIGLTRADLSVVQTLSLGEDPTSHLGSIASARLRSAESAARMVG